MGCGVEAGEADEDTSTFSMRQGQVALSALRRHRGIQVENAGTRMLIVNTDGRVLADSQGSWVGRDVDLRLPQDRPPAPRPYVQGRVVTREGTLYYVAVTASLGSRSQADRELPT
jgi:hypothetical protein